MIKDARADRVIGRIADLFARVLGENLVGIYVHGSLAFGCFTWETGDIDLIIVVKNEPEPAQKREIIETVIEIGKSAPAKGVEFSVLLADDCGNFSHPMPYVMHCSNAHTERYLSDMDGHIARLRGTDRDLAAHLTVMKAAGFPFMGPPVADVFGNVPPEAYLDSLMSDIGDARMQIADEPVYIALNLCRVLAWLREGKVLSKEDGGKWGRDNLPGRFLPLVEAALECYRTGADMPGFGSLAEEFAGFMLESIEGETALRMKG